MLLVVNLCLISTTNYQSRRTDGYRTMIVRLERGLSWTYQIDYRRGATIKVMVAACLLEYEIVPYLSEGR